MQIIKTMLKYKNPLTPLAPEQVLFLIVHHIDASKATPEQIHEWHLDRNWSGFGYNEYIKKDGTVYIGRGDNVGAHTKGYNENGYGIALEGKYDVELMPIAQYDSLIERLKYHKNRFVNLKSIAGHRDLGATSCPGKNVKMDIIVQEVYKVEKITDINKALDVLVNAKIINSKDYWLKTVDTVNYQRDFILNIANFIKQ